MDYIRDWWALESLSVAVRESLLVFLVWNSECKAKMEKNFSVLRPEARWIFWEFLAVGLDNLKTGFSCRISADGSHLLGWNVPPEDLRQIPDHWLTYPEPEASLHYLLGLVYIMFTVAALTGNGLVLWIFGSSAALRTPSNVFVVNLALCDFMMMLKAPIFIFNSFHRGFATGVTGCQLFAAMGSLSGIGAGMTNACIAYDRFNVITRPFHAKMTRLKAIMIVLLVWGYTIPWTVLPLMEIWGRFVPGKSKAFPFNSSMTSKRHHDDSLHNY